MRITREFLAEAARAERLRGCMQLGLILAAGGFGLWALARLGGAIAALAFGGAGFGGAGG